MENIFTAENIDILIKLAISVVTFIFVRIVWPAIKDWAIMQKAIAIVHQMEETYGAKTGQEKFDEAIALLGSFFDMFGWKVDMEKVEEYITAAVGALHAAQGKKPPLKIPVE